MCFALDMSLWDEIAYTTNYYAVIRDGESNPKIDEVHFMKKAIVIVCVALIALFCVFLSLGKQYVMPKEVSPQQAIENTRQMLDYKSRDTIKNINKPKVEEVVFNKALSIGLFVEKSEVIGRELYKITYNTEQDGLLGPIVFYVDKLSGEIIGMDYRE